MVYRICTGSHAPKGHPSLRFAAVLMVSDVIAMFHSSSARCCRYGSNGSRRLYITSSVTLWITFEHNCDRKGRVRWLRHRVEGQQHLVLAMMQWVERAMLHRREKIK